MIPRYSLNYLAQYRKQTDAQNLTANASYVLLPSMLLNTFRIFYIFLHLFDIPRYKIFTKPTVFLNWF